MKHSKAWGAWLIVTMAIILSTRNPVYLLVLLISLLTLGSFFKRKDRTGLWLLQNLRFSGTMILLSSLINAIFTHTGKHVIFTIPVNWPLIGGPITLESLIFGMVNGLIIGSLYLAFNIFNLVLNIKQITGLIPKIFHPISITITIALTFFPSVQQRAKEIREAQLIRGNQMKRISDWLPLFLPLLITSLENAIVLSESMTARGYHSQRSAVPARIVTSSLIFSAFLIFSGWILGIYDYPILFSTGLYSIGGLVILIIFLYANRRVKITRYHHETWHRRDSFTVLLLVTAFVVWIVLQTGAKLPTAAYSVYPALSFPAVQVEGIVLSCTPIIPLPFLNK